MSLKYFAKELKGIWSMAIFNLLHKVYCQVRQSCSFSLKTVWLVEYIIYRIEKCLHMFVWNKLSNEKLLGGQGW